MKYVKTITPFFILFVAAIVGIIYFIFKRNLAPEAGETIMIALIAAALIFMALDHLLKWIFKAKTHYIWITEAILLVAAIYIFTVT